jgi:hypothetical protein
MFAWTWNDWAGLAEAVAASKLVATLAAFALILLLARLKLPLSLAILGGVLALGWLFGLGAWDVVAVSLAGAVQPITIGLCVAVVLLLSISEAMRQAGQLTEIVALAKAFLRRPAVTMAALPALIGLLPMPGGALFSAPMVEAAAGEASVGRDRLSAVNYWFRHIWEYWWPLYPGVILALTLTASDLGTFVLYQIPLGLFMATGGLVIFRGAAPDLHRRAPRPPPGQARRLLRVTSTIWVILLVWGVASVAVAAGARLLPDEPAGRQGMAIARKFVPLTVGLLVGLLWTMRMNRLGGRQVGRILTRPALGRMVVLVVSVMVFQHLIQHVEAAPRIAEELTGLRVPVILVVIVLPLIAGLVTGLAVGFVGTSFPIVLGLVAALPGEPSIRPYVALAYAFGHLGQMLSPLHVCHVVSNRYFKTGFAAVYPRILPAAAVTAVLAVSYFLLLRQLLG